MANRMAQPRQDEPKMEEDRTQRHIEDVLGARVTRVAEDAVTRSQQMAQPAFQTGMSYFEELGRSSEPIQARRVRE